MDKRKNVDSRKRATPSSLENINASVAKKPVERVSKRLDPKTANQFGTQKFATSFSNIYSKGGIPFRLEHGSVKHKLRWLTAPEQLDTFDPLLVLLLDGLRETDHPYSFLARQGAHELLNSRGAFEKILPLLPRAASALRQGLTSKDKQIFLKTLSVLEDFAVLIGPYAAETLLAPSAGIVSQLASKSFIKEFKQPIEQTLYKFEENGGPEAYKAIKAKVPTWHADCAP